MRASVRGTSHVRVGTRLQDASRCFEKVSEEGDQSLIAIVCDGAGSAAFGGQGASIACRTLATLATNALDEKAALPDDELIWSWIDTVRDRVHTAAARRDLKARDFAATLVMMIATPSHVLTAHVGDGAIVARERDTGLWALLSAPSHGEYASTTFFLTDDPQPALRISRADNRFDALVAFSDGIEGFALDAATGAPAAIFFDPILRPLASSSGVGRDRRLSDQLAEFLASDRVTERTDDDKTLIVAVAR